jgi:hypothetical protein
VLRMRFGLDGTTEQTLEEIGASFQLTRERIRQIESQALGKLRARCAPSPWAWSTTTGSGSSPGRQPTRTWIAPSKRPSGAGSSSENASSSHA